MLRNIESTYFYHGDPKKRKDIYMKSILIFVLSRFHKTWKVLEPFNKILYLSHTVLFGIYCIFYYFEVWSIKIPVCYGTWIVCMTVVYYFNSACTIWIQVFCCKTFIISQIFYYSMCIVQFSMHVVCFIYLY